MEKTDHVDDIKIIFYRCFSDFTKVILEGLEKRLEEGKPKEGIHYEISLKLRGISG